MDQADPIQICFEKTAQKITWITWSWIAKHGITNLDNSDPLFEQLGTEVTV